ncbi:hypothetical protein BGZ61DRAFT_438988, partial [Ilyonectria robusta]|uniref:uncharacterized protein n=1 Tax=Ilyonectria robusta TaxID=1079257 RepID=UPI001E8CDDB6
MEHGGRFRHDPSHEAHHSIHGLSILTIVLTARSATFTPSPRASPPSQRLLPVNPGSQSPPASKYSIHLKSLLPSPPSCLRSDPDPAIWAGL